MHTLSVKQHVVKLTFDQPKFNMIHKLDFRKRPASKLAEVCKSALIGPSLTAAPHRFEKESQGHLNKNEFGDEIETVVEKSYLMGELISEYKIYISINTEVYPTLKVGILTIENEKMAIDLIRKDPNFCSILNHMTQKFHKFHLQVKHLQTNLPQETKTDFIEVLFSEAKVAKIKLVNAKDKKQAKQIVCYHILKIVFPEVFSLTENFLRNIYPEGKIEMPKENHVNVLPRAPPVTTHDKEAERNELINQVALLLEDFINSFEISSAMLNFQSTKANIKDSFLDVSGFTIVSDNLGDAPNILCNYFETNFPQSLFKLSFVKSVDGKHTGYFVTVQTENKSPLQLFKSTVASTNARIVEIFLEKFAKRVVCQLRIK
jgi:hypothetical protein